MDKYVTIQGDMWDSIAFKVYGHEHYMAELMAANPQHLSTTIFSANIELFIPFIETPVSNALPPWKRGELSGIETS